MPYKIVRNSIESFVRDNAQRIEVSHTPLLWMQVSCFNKYPDQWEEKSIPKPLSRILSYEASADDCSIKIVPRLSYLDAIRKGDPVPSIPYMWQPFRWLPLNLDMRFHNTTASPLFVTDVDIHVKRSVLNKEPLLYIQRGCPFPMFYITNDGWCAIQKPELQIAITEAKGEVVFPDHLDIEVPVSEFSDFVEIDLTKQFESLGVDVAAVMKHDSHANLGPFKQRLVWIYGQLSFTDGNDERRQFRFATDMHISGLLCGMYAPPSYEYHTRLEVERDNYVKSVSVSQVIPSNGFDRFLLQLDVAKSSNHEFEIEIVGSQGVLARSAPIKASILVPRSVAERFPYEEGIESFLSQ